MVVKCYDQFVYMPRSEVKWEDELRGFLENYGFPCVGAWDGFHVEWCTKLKNHYSFNPTYYRPFGATSDIGGAQCTPPISYACSTCAIVMKL